MTQFLVSELQTWSRNLELVDDLAVSVITDSLKFLKCLSKVFVWILRFIRISNKSLLYVSNEIVNVSTGTLWISLRFLSNGCRCVVKAYSGQ